MLVTHVMILTPRNFDEYFQVPVRNKRPLQLSVIGTLSSMAPAEKYIKVDVSSPAGYVIGSMSFSSQSQKDFNIRLSFLICAHRDSQTNDPCNCQSLAL